MKCKTKKTRKALKVLHNIPFWSIFFLVSCTKTIEYQHSQYTAPNNFLKWNTVAFQVIYTVFFHIYCATVELLVCSSDRLKSSVQQFSKRPSWVSNTPQNLILASLYFYAFILKNCISKRFMPFLVKFWLLVLLFFFFKYGTHIPVVVILFWLAPQKMYLRIRCNVDKSDRTEKNYLINK